jgi:hypothetical protein
MPKNTLPDGFKLATFVRSLVPHLAGWTYQTPSDGQTDVWERLSGPDGSSLGFYLNDRSGMIEVSGNFIIEFGNIYPYDAYRRVSSINVSPARKPDVLARDIQKRLIDAYLPVYREGKEQFERYNAQDLETKRLATELARYVNDTRHEDGCTDIWHVLANPSNKDQTIRVDLRVNSPTSVTVKLSSITPDLAKKVIDLFGVLAKDPYAREKHEG